MSELHKYHVSILQETKQWERALDYLMAHESEICDKTWFHENRFELLMTLKKTEDAEALARMLIARNPDNLNYHSYLRRSFAFDGNCCSGFLLLYC